MPHNLLSCMLITVLLSVVAIRPAYAKPQGQESLEQTEKVKAKVGKMYTLRKPRVKVKLNDGRKLKGYISEAAEDYFVVVDPGAGVATTVHYTQVRELKRSKPSSAWVIAVAAGTLGLVIISFLLSPGS